MDKDKLISFVKETQIYTVKVAAYSAGISYSTACRWLRELNIDGQGNLKTSRLRYTKSFVSFLQYLPNHFSNIQEISEFLGVTRAEVSSMYSTAKVSVKWSLENNHNDLLSASRRAEIFCKNLGIRVIRDCYLTRPAGFPYDLILEGYGSVDVKSTVLQQKGRDLFVSFSVSNFKTATKYAFLVVFDESRTNFLAVFAVPSKVARNHSTLSFWLSPLSPKYKDFLIWKSEVAPF